MMPKNLNRRKARLRNREKQIFLIEEKRNHFDTFRSMEGKR